MKRFLGPSSAALVVASIVLALTGIGPRYVAPVSSKPPDPRLLPAAPAVGAMGRLEPKDGVVRVAGPARPSAVVASLFVQEGDRVAEGAALAVLDAHQADAALVARASAELADARSALARVERLFHEGVMAEAVRDDARRRLAVAEADLALARATFELDTVRAPATGRVLRLHARPGERIGPEGLLELGHTDVMYAVAEVYETDIAAVRAGQRATVRSPALERPLNGWVERVGLEVRKQAVLADDPAADVDARVVEVHVRLDDSERATELSNLQVDVVIETEAP